MLRWRLLLGSGIVSALVLLCWLDLRAAWTGIWLLPLALAATVAGGDEVLALVVPPGVAAPRAAVAGGSTLVALASWAAHAVACGGAPFTWVAAALVAALLLLLAGELARFRTPGSAVPRLAAGALALLYVGLPMSFLIQLRFVGGARSGLVALLSVIVVVKSSDIGAYFVGRLAGRRRLAPRLSPGKTVEGLAGGVGVAIVAAIVVFAGLGPRITGHPATADVLAGSVVFALLVALAGLVGDLAESLLKRDAGRKDSSAWMPGFGGVLDVLDSLLVAAPVGYFCWTLGLVRA